MKEEFSCNEIGKCIIQKYSSNQYNNLDLYIFESYINFMYRNGFIKFKLNENKFSALVSFSEGIGIENFKKIISKYNDEEMYNYIKKYDDNTNSLYYSTLRRLEEAALFNNGKLKEIKE